MSIPVMALVRRKKLLALLKKLEATSLENAVTIQKINEKCSKVGIEPLRSIVIARSIEVLVRRGEIQKTEDNKFYLAIRN